MRHLAARNARRALEYDRAGAWHLRAHKLAVRANDDGERVWALIGCGAMMKATSRSGAGRTKRLAEAERMAAELVGIFGEYGPSVFIHLAEGWRACADWERADRYAEAALRAAEQRQEPHLGREAADLRETIRQRGSAAKDEPPSARTSAVLRTLSARLSNLKQALG